MLFIIAHFLYFCKVPSVVTHVQSVFIHSEYLSPRQRDSSVTQPETKSVRSMRRLIVHIHRIFLSEISPHILIQGDCSDMVFSGFSDVYKIFTL